MEEFCWLSSNPIKWYSSSTCYCRATQNYAWLRERSKGDSLGNCIQNICLYEPHSITRSALKVVSWFAGKTFTKTSGTNIFDKLFLVVESNEKAACLTT